MTIKWVQQDPLVLNGEPFCYGSRLTVRQLLELRANGYDLARILTDHPELRTLYPHIDELRSAMGARATAIDRLLAESEAYDRDSYKRGLLVLGHGRLAGIGE